MFESGDEVCVLSVNMKPNILGTLVNKKCNKRGFLEVKFDGVTHSVDKKRVLPREAYQRAIITNSGGSDYFCPVDNCTSTPVFNGSAVICPIHGEKQPYVIGKTNEIIVETPNITNVTKEIPTMADTATLNEAQVKEYGELWVKTFTFNHAKASTKAYVLLGENPNRKLCFNAFNGTLGKKSKDPIAELELEAFKNTNSEKPKYYVLKEDLAKVRTKLTKEGYIQL